jgi:CRP/FNR family transcriptional regulator
MLHKEFVTKLHVKHFRKGEIILYQGEVPPSIYIVKKGIVKTYNLTTQGEEKPITFDATGEIFPIAWAFNKIRYSQYYYEAFTDCDIYTVSRTEYHEFLKANPDAMYESFNGFVNRYINFQMRVNALEQSKAVAKIINTIHFLCLHFGRELKDNVVQIDLPLTQQDLANFMGLTRETPVIELKKLQRQGILSYKRQSYIVKTDKLDELLDEEYDQGRI